MLKIIAVLFIPFMLFGCVSGPYNASGWHRPGATQEQTQRDFNECRMYGQAHSEMNALMAMDLTAQCMKGKGYRVSD